MKEAIHGGSGGAGERGGGCVRTAGGRWHQSEWTGRGTGTCFPIPGLPEYKIDMFYNFGAAELDATTLNWSWTGCEWGSDKNGPELRISDRHESALYNMESFGM